VKRRILLSLSSSLPFLAACGQLGVPGTGPATPQKALSGTVQILHNAAFPFNDDVGGSIARDFMAKHPEVKIDSQPLSGNAVEKITAAVAGGDAPEMVTIGTHEVQTLAANGAIRSLEDYYKQSATLKKTDVWPTLVDDFTYQGKAHGVPYGPDMRILYISVDKYRGAGLNVNSPPKTWAEFEEVINKTRKGGGTGPIETLGFDPFLGSGGIYRWLVPYWQLGGELLSPDKTKVTINNERAIQALTWLKKIIDAQGGYQQMLDFEKGITYQQLFMDNKAAHMYATYAERAQEFRPKAPNFEFSFVPYPLPPSGRKANYGGGHTWPILQASKNPDAAWGFIDFLSLEDNNIKFTDRYDRIPLRQKTVQSDKWHKNDPFRKLAAEEMQGRRFVIAAPGGAEALAHQGTFVTDIMLGKTNIREGLAAAEQQIQQVLDKYKR
jgi:multiple sugar transport system substrate-binding protein